MTMSDVTLYAKWLKEDMTVSGTYDIDFEAEILEDTIKKGQTADEFGGYKKFPENISVENTYICLLYTSIRPKRGRRLRDERNLLYRADCGLPFVCRSHICDFRKKRKGFSNRLRGLQNARYFKQNFVAFALYSDGAHIPADNRIFAARKFNRGGDTGRRNRIRCV